MNNLHAYLDKLAISYSYKTQKTIMNREIEKNIKLSVHSKSISIKYGDSQNYISTTKDAVYIL